MKGKPLAGLSMHRQIAPGVINGIKVNLKSKLAAGLLEVVAGYDRSGLIHASIETLQRDLLEEAVIVSIVIIIFLFHFRSALIPIRFSISASFVAFIPMRTTSTSLRISCRSAVWPMRLAFSWTPPSLWSKTDTDVFRAPILSIRAFSEPRRRKILLDSAKQVTFRNFLSLAIIVISFLPVFLLKPSEGRMFLACWRDEDAVCWSPS